MLTAFKVHERGAHSRSHHVHAWCLACWPKNAEFLVCHCLSFTLLSQSHITFYTQWESLGFSSTPAALLSTRIWSSKMYARCPWWKQSRKFFSCFLFLVYFLKFLLKIKKNSPSLRLKTVPCELSWEAEIIEASVTSAFLFLTSGTEPRLSSTP